MNTRGGLGSHKNSFPSQNIAERVKRGFVNNLLRNPKVRSKGQYQVVAVQDQKENQQWGLYNGAMGYFFCKFVGSVDKEGNVYVQKLYQSKEDPLLFHIEESIVKVPAGDIKPVGVKEEFGRMFRVTTNPMDLKKYLTHNNARPGGNEDRGNSQGCESVVSLDNTVDTDDDDDADDKEESRTLENCSETSSVFQQLMSTSNPGPAGELRTTEETVEVARSRSQSPLTIQVSGSERNQYESRGKGSTKQPLSSPMPILGGTPLGLTPRPSPSSKPPLAPKGNHDRGATMVDGNAGWPIAFGTSHSLQSTISGGDSDPSPQQTARDGSKLLESFTDSPLIVTEGKGNIPSSAGSNRSSVDGDGRPARTPSPQVAMGNMNIFANGNYSHCEPGSGALRGLLVIGETPKELTFISQPPPGPGVARAQPLPSAVARNGNSAIFGVNSMEGRGSLRGININAAESAAGMGGGRSGFSAPPIRVNPMQTFSGAFPEVSSYNITGTSSGFSISTSGDSTSSRSSSSSSSSSNSSSRSSSSNSSSDRGRRSGAGVPDEHSGPVSHDGLDSMAHGVHAAPANEKGSAGLELSDNDEEYETVTSTDRGAKGVLPPERGGQQHDTAIATSTGTAEFEDGSGSGSDEDSLLEEETEGESESESESENGGEEMEEGRDRSKCARVRQHHQEAKERDDDDEDDEVVEASSEEEDSDEELVYCVQDLPGRRVARGALQAALSGGDTLTYVSSPEQRAALPKAQERALAFELSPGGAGFPTGLSPIGMVTSPESGGRTQSESAAKRPRALSTGSTSSFSCGAKRGGGSAMDTSATTDGEFDSNSSQGSAVKGKRRRTEGSHRGGAAKGSPPCSLSLAISS